jgi:hypothetical protein
MRAPDYVDEIHRRLIEIVVGADYLSRRKRPCIAVINVDPPCAILCCALQDIDLILDRSGEEPAAFLATTRHNCGNG